MNDVNKFDINKQTLLETRFVGCDFILNFYTTEPIIITRTNNKDLYDSLTKIMSNNYKFDSSGLSYKLENEICWFSDQYCDLDDIVQTNRVNRLFIRQNNSVIELTVVNPYFEKKGINIENYVVSFSPSGNGLYSLNENTGLTFQDDMIMAFRNIVIEKENNKIYSKSYK